MFRCVSCFVVVFVLLCSYGCSRTGVTSGRTVAAVGDSADYELTSTMQGLVGPGLDPKQTGRMKYQVLVSSNHGRAVPSNIVETFDLRQETVLGEGNSGMSRTVVYWFGQDSSKNQYLLGISEDGVNFDVVTDTNPPLCMPSRLQQGMSWQYQAHLASGETLSSSCKCVGMEKIKVRKKTVDAYKLETSQSWKGLLLSGYVWLGTDVPSVFELKTELDVKGASPGADLSTHMAYEMQDLRLVQAKQ